MGNWSLERLTAVSSPMTAPHFGNEYRAVFHLRYAPSPLGTFKELPRLDWHETIMMNDRQNNECWLFDNNMYEHNPTSATLLVWARRYVEAYRYVANLGRGVQRGRVEFKTANGSPVRINDLRPNLTNGQEQADAVRSYLKRHGGQLIIEIHDVPGINPPTQQGQHKERLLLFNIGVTGMPLRSKAEQYLNVQFGVAPANWDREFNANRWTRARLNTTGLAPVAVPPGVGTPRAALFTAGECW